MLKNLALLFLFIFSNACWAAATDELLQISNAPQCAADLSKPTFSIFLAVSFGDTAGVLKELAPQIQKDPVALIKEGNRAFKIKLTDLSEKIIRALDSGELPLIQQKNDSLIAESWAKLNGKSAAQNLDDLKCYQVNDINSYYSHLFIRGVNESTLTALAKQYKDAHSRINGCTPENLEGDLNFYPVFNFDFKPKSLSQWNKSGFEFWTSFKIYLSWAWRNTESNEGLFKRVFKSIPIEEQVVILSNGCKGLSRPECSSDFLSSTELRSLFTLDRKKLDLTSSTLEMTDNIEENNDAVDSKAQQQLAVKADENQWVRTFQKSYMGFTQANKIKLYETSKLMNSLVTQIGDKRLIEDLSQAELDKKQTENFYYLCAESNLINLEIPMSLFKSDMNFIHQQGAKLDHLLKFGLTVEEMITFYEKMAPQMTSLCSRFSKDFGNRDQFAENITAYRPWYKNYLSRYKSMNDSIQTEQQNQEKPAPIDPATLTYLPGQCADAIDCGRRMIEGVININKILLHAKTFLREDFSTPPLFNERAEKIACGVYDPWEAGHLNNKKLMADIGSSLLFGWTNLPIYLDLNFPRKELVSMKNLIENGQVHFDPGFDQGKVQKSISLSFGALFDVPCSVQISQTVNTDIAQDPTAYIFSGLSVNAGACKGNKTDHLSSPNQQTDTFKKTAAGDHSVCGQCAINFTQLAPVIAKNAFAPLRFFIRLGQSLARYYTVKNDDTINPRQMTINPRYLVDAYDKYHDIPSQCVKMLTHGLRCQANMCEALAVKEFEMKTGLEISEINLGENMDGRPGEYDKAYIKAKGCSEEMTLSLRCSGNGDSFYMPILNSAVKKCKAEVSP